MRHRLVLEESLQEALHLRAISRYEKVLAGCEERLGIIPWRREQGDTARQGFERTNRWNAGKEVDIGTTGHMYGDFEAREDAGYLVVGQPSGIGNAGTGQGNVCPCRIPHAISASLQS